MKHRPAHATVVAWLALVLAVSGTAYAATGGSFVLGHTNKAAKPSRLVNTGTGPALSLKSSGAPLGVSNTKKVARLNADLLDGRSSAAFQHRVTGTCSAGKAITAVKPGGKVSCGSPAFAVYFAVVNSDGTLARGSAGASSSRSAMGTYKVTFPIDITACAYTATPGVAGSAGAVAPGSTSVAGAAADPDSILLQTGVNGGNADMGSHIIVAC